MKPDLRQDGKMKILILLFILVAFPVQAAQLIISTDPGASVFVFKTEDLMEYGIQHILDHKSVYDQKFIFTLVAIVSPKTECSIIKSNWSCLQIRILEGKFRGIIGWVPRETLKP
jgi:hypothetical protein